MSSPAYQFTTPEVPLAYDALLVPHMFAPWCEVLLDAAGPRRGEAVLDIATGPGTVARAVARWVGPTGRVIATDVSPHMLEVARRKWIDPDAAPIEWVDAPAVPLPVPDEAFDLVTCQQGLQFFPDRLAALEEMRRVLRPGGRVAVAVWAAIERCGIFAALHAALRDAVPADLADRLLVPWSMPDAAVLERALSALGFVEVIVETRTLGLAFEGGLDHAAAALTATPLGPTLAALPDDRRAALAVAARRRLAPFLDPADGVVTGEMTCNVAIGRRRG